MNTQMQISRNNSAQAQHNIQSLMSNLTLQKQSIETQISNNKIKFKMANIPKNNHSSN